VNNTAIRAPVGLPPQPPGALTQWIEQRECTSATVRRGRAGERVKDDHVDRFAAAVARPSSSSALEAGTDSVAVPTKADMRTGGGAAGVHGSRPGWGADQGKLANNALASLRRCGSNSATPSSATTWLHTCAAATVAPTSCDWSCRGRAAAAAGDRALARLELDFYLRTASPMPGGPCVDALNIRRLPLRGEATWSTHFER
jgi:hypothetical protein